MQNVKYEVWAPFVAAFLLLSPSSYAEDCKPMSRAAESLFQKGKASFDTGRIDDACALLEQSQRLEASVGTLGLWAACLEKQGKLASAKRAYEQAAARAKACRDSRRAFAQQRADALAVRVPRLRLTLVDAEAKVELWRGGVKLDAVQPGKESEVDPGQLDIMVRAPGKAEFFTSVDVTEGARLKVKVPALSPLSRYELAPPVSTEKAPPKAGTGPGALAYVLGSVGVTGLGLGIGAGIVALQKKSDSSSYCDENDRCLPRGGALREEGRTAAAISTIGFGIGVAGIGAFTILALTSGKKSEKTPVRDETMALVPSVSPSGVGASFTGSF